MALKRTQPILPLGPGVPVRQSHDYERHGVTSLFSAMDLASGVTISTCYRRHRHQEFLRFLDQIETRLPGGSEVHLVMDNYGTHKVAKVRGWLTRHPRYHVHFTPTSGSWLNLVERLFGEVTERCVRRGSHTALGALEKAMLDYLDQRNENPKPLVWTVDAGTPWPVGYRKQQQATCRTGPIQHQSFCRRARASGFGQFHTTPPPVPYPPLMGRPPPFGNLSSRFTTRIT